VFTFLDYGYKIIRGKGGVVVKIVSFFLYPIFHIKSASTNLLSIAWTAISHKLCSFYPNYFCILGALFAQGHRRGADYRNKFSFSIRMSIKQLSAVKVLPVPVAISKIPFLWLSSQF
jgi:hypothetical protein